jgi:hypothetical protein
VSLQTWRETLITAQSDGTALASSTTATSILPAGAKLTLPANYLNAPGRKLTVLASGRISTTTGPPSITFEVRFGSTAVFSSGTVVTVASVTNKTWRLWIELTCRSIGASTSATLFGTGSLTSSAVVGATGGAATTAMLPDATPAVGTGFDSTASQVVDLYATWSASSASNSVQCHQYDLVAD